MKKLTVGLFNDSFPPNIDGVANTVVNYARVIQEKFGRSVVVAPKYRDVVDDYPFKVIRYQSLPTDKTKIRYRTGNPFSINAIRKVSKENLDLIHCHSPFTAAMLAKNVNTRHRLPVVMTYHTKFDDDIAFTVKSKSLRKMAADIVVNSFNYADEVWTVSHGCAKSLRALGYQGDYRVMVNGADITLDPASDEIMRKVQADTGFNSGELVFMYCGRMQWYKGIKIIIDALVKVKAAGARFRMIFVGGGFELEEIKEYTRKSGLMGQTLFTGPIYDRALLKGYFTRADLFLFPSTYDTAGLVVMEAAACKTPSVLIKDSCASEIVTDGRNGYISEENADSFSAAIISATGDRSALAQIGEKAAEEVYLSWDDSVTNAYKRYEEIYDEWKSFGPMLRKSIRKKDNE
jgi:Glycosyltransferase